MSSSNRRKRSAEHGTSVQIHSRPHDKTMPFDAEVHHSAGQISIQGASVPIHSHITDFWRRQTSQEHLAKAEVAGTIVMPCLVGTAVAAYMVAAAVQRKLDTQHTGVLCIGSIHVEVADLSLGKCSKDSSLDSGCHNDNSCRSHRVPVRDSIPQLST